MSGWTIRAMRPEEGVDMVALWRRSVDATHDFVSPDDKAEIAKLVADFLPKAPLMLAVDEDDRPLGFMLVEDGHMEALFIEPAMHGKGVGRALLAHALEHSPALTTDVNEGNPSALAFYEHCGFVRTGRSPLDGQGRPYPLIHLAYDPDR